MNGNILQKEESDAQGGEKWKIMQWLWDNLVDCPNIDCVNDVAAIEGTMTFLTETGNEYTLKITKGNWREL